MPFRRPLAAALLLVSPLLAVAQDTGTRSREIAPEASSFDREEVWNLHFEFQDPRIIVEKVPGRGNKLVWYMVYWVSNRDPKGDVHTLVPDIELVTIDRMTTHPDEILPSVEAVIKKREDPTGRFKIKNSVTISEDPIPLSKPRAFPTRVAGVAMWTDVDPAPDAKEKASRTNKFSIFVAGLSNGWVEEKKADGTKVIKRKTLQLDFERLGSGEKIEPSGIRWTGNATWMYRETTGVPAKKDKDADPKGADPKKDDAGVRLAPLPGVPAGGSVKTEPIPALPVRNPRKE